MPKKKTKKQSYAAKDITVLEGLEPVRKRPGMYIGTTGPEGLHHLIWEVFDNSRDEAMAGFADRVEVVLLPGNKVRVADNGRGIPVDKHKKAKVSALEVIMTTLHAGGKFGGEGYKVSGGLHGVGVSVVNALSEWARAEVHREGGKYTQEYSRGAKKANVKKEGKSDWTGTVIAFQPDPEVFQEIEFNWQKIVARLRQQAYLVKEMRVHIIDAREYGGEMDTKSVFWFDELGLDLPSISFYFEGGLKSFVRYHNEPYKAVQSEIFYIDTTIEKDDNTPQDIEVEIAFQYVDDISTRLFAFANNIYTAEGGMHVTGFKSALTRTINQYARDNSILKEKDDNLSGDDVLEGLTAIISVKLAEIQFEGQTKAKLGSPEARGAVETAFNNALQEYFEEHPSDAKSVIQKSILAMRARKAAKAAKDSVLRKGALEGMTLPGKLADCQTKSAEEAELFIVEGDSAGGCFSGNTQVALADGRNLSFKELVEEEKAGKQNFCYTIRKNGQIGIEKIKNPRVTKKNTKVIQITLDNGEDITCTPDHKFMLRDGSYKEARNLTKNDSLMPLYRKHSDISDTGITIDGYEMVWDPRSDWWIFTHMLADWYNLWKKVYSKEDGNHRHHKDFNKLNNNPTNIIRLPREEHMSLHMDMLDKGLHRPDVKEKCRQIHRTKKFREKMSKRMKKPKTRAILSRQAKKQWADEEYKEFMMNTWKEFYDSNPEYRDTVREQLTKAQEEYWSNAENRKKQSKRVAKYFADHPEARDMLSDLAQEQWADEELREWRSKKTKEQWTPEFRKKRAKTLQKTYYRKTIKMLKDFESKDGINIDSYRKRRIALRDKSLLRFDTFCERYFDGDENKAYEAVSKFNHKVVGIKKISKRMDVYDIEVPHTHNFALASGVFVHNSAKQGRDNRTQAVLPLRGKILNVERARLDRMLKNEQVKNLVIAIGTAIGDTFDISGLRYHKIIIATDADVDGAHIRTLLLTLFYRYFRPIIDDGYLYIAQPPLYKIEEGKTSNYFYTEEEKLEYLKSKGVDEEKASEVINEGISADEAAAATRKISIQRYKGLGEMNPEELWETTMDPSNRVLKQVTIEDAEAANRIFETLMGSDVPPRKSFIQSNAKMATIDV